MAEPIAIVGIGCRLPGAAGPKALWELVTRGRDAIREVPRDRWNADAFFDPTPGAPGKMNTRWGGFLDRVDLFDAGFFGIDAAEAASMDPQQRLLLEVAYEALEEAGQVRSQLRGTPVGVFVGMSSADYPQLYLRDPKHVGAYSITGAAASVAANRLSFFFDFRGPSLVVDTACSSSLVAVHLACQSIWRGESELALAGGVNVMLSPLITVGFSHAQATSPDGRCKAFDAGANGIVRGEGAALVVLKPLARALADADAIHAVIRGSGVAQDGLSNGLSAPSPWGQEAVLRAAYRTADIAPASVRYVEAHGTGTMLGDPIEAHALGKVLSEGRAVDDACRIGSIKTNIGHLEAAAGIAGLVKTCLALQHRALPPSLHFRTPNPHIPFDALRLKVQTALEPWPAGPVLAGVSAFGFGGTNAHVVLEAAPRRTPRGAPASTRPRLLPLSAHTEAGVQQLASSLRSTLDGDLAGSLDDLAFTASRRRDHHDHRTAIVFRDADELRRGLDSVASAAAVPSHVLPRRKRKLAFVFSGMGSQRPGMGRELLGEPAFVETLARVDDAMRPFLHTSVRAELEAGEASPRVNDPEVVQPLLFAVQLGLAAVWRSYGIEPDAVVGSSMGEVAAAQLAGALSLDDAARIICLRARLLRGMVGTGAMAVAELPADRAEALLAGTRAWVAARNSPRLTVLAGEGAALEAALAQLRADGVFCRMIAGATAPSHTPLMEALREPLLDVLHGVAPQPARLPFYSTVTASRVSGEQLGAEYWWRNVREPIALVETLAAVEASGPHVYVELSPHPVLTTAVVDTLRELGRDGVALPSLHRDHADSGQLLDSLGQLHALGFRVRWERLAEAGEHVALPTYPWQRESYWLVAPTGNADLALGVPAANPSERAAAGARERLDRDALRALAPAEQHAQLVAYLRAHVARVLKLPAAELDVAAPLKNLGVGSLMGMELNNRVRAELGTALPIAQFLQGPSIEDIARLVVAQLAAVASAGDIHPVPRARALPLSFPQRQMWLLAQLEGDSPTYHVPAGVWLDGRLDLDALEASLREIVRRHEVLRTTFAQEGGQPVQHIAPGVRLDLPLVDVSELAEEERAPEALRLAVEEAQRPFDLARGPVLRVLVIRVAPERHLFVLTVHHIAADGWSLGVMLNELAALYPALATGSPAPLAPLPFQYGDYAVWQRNRLDGDGLQGGLAFWKRRLAGAPELLSLPTDRPRPAAQSLRGALYNFSLPVDLSEALRALSRRAGNTLFVTLLSAFQAVVRAYTGELDLVIGTPIAGRHHPGLERLVGYFLNMVPVRVDVDAQLAFTELLARTRDAVLEAYAHQETPFEAMVEALRPTRAPSHHPIIQVVFALHATVEPERLPGLSAEPVDLDIGVSRFDLTLSFMDRADGLRGSFEYATDLFDRVTIDRLRQHYEAVLRAIVADTARPVEALLELPAAERATLERVSRGPRLARPTASVLAQLERQATHRPDALAIASGERTLSYGELDARARALAGRLREHGVRAGDLVALCLDRSPELVIGMLAAWKAGGAYLPLDPTHPAQRLRALIEDARPKVLITHERQRADLEGSGVALLCVDATGGVAPRPTGGAGVAPAPLRAAPVDATGGVAPRPTGGAGVAPIPHLRAAPVEGEPPADPHAPLTPREPAEDAQLAYVIYTSGSTGQPKGVAVSRASLANLIGWHRTTYAVTPTDRSTLVAGPAFDASTWEIWPYLAAGASLHVVPDEDRAAPRRLAAWLVRERITVSFLPTPLLEAMMAVEWPAGSSLRALLTGGDRLGKWPGHTLPAPLFNQYGPTEATVVATWGEVPGAGDRAAPGIGRPIANTEAWVLDEQRRLVPIGIPGELYLGGAGLATGYWQRPDLEAGRFVDGPPELGRLYRTGDRARWLADGQLEFLGRRDEQVKIRGMRIELGEVEAALLAHPDVTQAAVTPQPHAAGHRLVAHVVGATPDVDPRALQRFLRERLPDPMVPAAIALVPALPLTPNGKVDRRALPALELPAHDRGAPPRTSTEREVARIWGELLGVDAPSLDDDFFASGGHSLLGIELLERVRTRLGVAVELRVLHTAPRLAALVQAVEAAQGSTRADDEVPLEPDLARRHEPFPLTDVQQAYWVGRTALFQLGGVGAHAYVELELPALDVEALQAALQELIARHDMLRAIVLPDGTQRIHARVPDFVIGTVDLRTQPPDAIEAALATLRAELSHQVFAPERWPLFDVRASLLPAGARLHLSVDALIADATSLVILSRELARLYADPAAELPPLDISFRDYVLALERRRGAPQVQTSRAYWTARLPSLPGGPELPLARDPASLSRPRFRRLSAQLAKPQWAALQQRAAREGLTPNAVLLTAFAEVLARFSKAARFTLTLTFFHRVPLHAQVAALVGDFTDLLPLEVDASARAPFAAFARRVHERLWEDLEHRHAGGVWVLRELAKARGAAGAAAPVVFTSLVGADVGAALAGGLGTWGYAITQTPQVWLDHQVAELDEALVFNWDSPEALFPEGMLDEMFTAYTRLLEHLASEDWARVELALPSPPTEVEAPPASDEPLRLEQLFLQAARERPDLLAVVTPEHRLTYGELRLRAGALARELRARGAAPDRLVAVVMEKGWEQVVAVLGILEAGAAYLPIDPDLPDERIAQLLSIGDVRLAVTQPGVDARLRWPAEIDRRVVARTELAPAAPALPPAGSPSDLAYVLFTSGSSGTPKGVMIEHRAAANTLVDTRRRFALGPGDKVFGFSSLGFDLSVFDIFGTLAAGGTLVLPAPSSLRDPSHWASLMQREHVTVWNSVPAAMRMLVEYAAGGTERFPSSLRLALLSGDWIPLSLPDRIRALHAGTRVVSLGGATEASIWSILHDIDDVDPSWRSIPYGRAMAGQRFHVLNERLEPCPTWVPGQLFIGGVGLARGYWRDEARTRASFITHPTTGERLYRTGDLGRWLPSGEIEFLGREDTQVKFQGHRVELGEIEAALARHPGVAACVVCAVGDRMDDKRLVAHVVTRGEPPAHAELNGFLRVCLPAYMVPAAYVRHDALPLTANGKLDRRALAQDVRSAAPVEPRAPHSELEQRIGTIVAELLELAQVDPHADLFALGASSVQVVMLANRLEVAFGHRPEIGDLFRLRTVSDLARYYAERGAHPAPGRAAATVLLEPARREAFKQARHGLREVGGPAIPLAERVDGGTAVERFRSVRQFSPTPVTRDELSRLLAALRELDRAGEPRLAYASAGGLYPVQLYLHIKPEGVAGLAPGTYYYHRARHELQLLTPAAELARELHFPLNYRTAEQARFTLFLVAQLGAIEPIYAEASRDYCLIEAGAMAQLLRMKAPDTGLGLCAVAQMDFERVRPLLALNDRHRFMLALLGGRPAEGAERAFSFDDAGADIDEWEELLL